MSKELEIIGLIPASGKASRIQPIPCSKEVMPIAFQQMANGQEAPRVISQNTVDAYIEAGASRIFFIIRKGKWDIPNYYGDGSEFGTQMAYLIMNRPFGIPYTLDQAHSYVQDAICLLGFPDMLVDPADAYKHLVDKLKEVDADVVLGLFPIHDEVQKTKSDMVGIDANGDVLDIQVKPRETNLHYSWGMAAWKPDFSNFMHEYLKEDEKKFLTNPDAPETYPGHVILEAAKAGMKVSSVCFDEGSFVDLGTPVKLKNMFSST
ncbi:MAG: dTDP-glucose pyrophosphorylase [Bacteroidia bacterium]|nr:dTDP-glucose pyrophosphorylase [Bacteroidia bacterium]